MKATLFTLVFGLSTSALACPNMEGTWSCKNADGSVETTTVAQSSITNGSLYTLTEADGSEQLYADGVTRPVSDSGLTGTLIVNCTGDNAVSAVENVSNAQGVKASLNVTYALTDANNMTNTATIDVTQPGQAPQSQTQSQTCARAQ